MEGEDNGRGRGVVSNHFVMQTYALGYKSANRTTMLKSSVSRHLNPYFWDDSGRGWDEWLQALTERDSWTDRIGPRVGYIEQCQKHQTKKKI